MKKSYIVRAIRPILHFFILLVIFFLIYKLRLVTDLIPGIQLPIPQIDYQSTMIFAGLSSLGFIIIGILLKFYVIHRKSDQSFFLLLKVWGYWVVINTFLMYFGTGFLRQYGASRFILLVSAIIALIIISVFDSFWFNLEKKYYQKNKRKALIISTNIQKHQELILNITDTTHYDIEVVSIEHMYHGNLENYWAVFVIGEIGNNILQDIFEEIRFAPTRLYHFSENQFLQDVVPQPLYIANTIGIEYMHSTLDGRSLVFKRMFDIIVSSLALILLFPVFIIVAIVIKIDSKGPILFFQKRVGKGGKLFTFVKFRSMVANAESLKQALLKKNERKGPLFKIKNDPRITRVGKFLRKTSIDELPQLLCVLVGTMSLVGPRPHLPAEIEKYEEREKRLLSVNPGITGYAQVFGRDNIPFSQEAKLDLYYIQNWSVAMDMYVILNTFLVVFKGK